MKKSQFSYQPLRGGIGQQCSGIWTEWFIDTGAEVQRGGLWSIWIVKTKSSWCSWCVQCVILSKQKLKELLCPKSIGICEGLSILYVFLRRWKLYTSSFMFGPSLFGKQHFNEFCNSICKTGGVGEGCLVGMLYRQAIWITYTRPPYCRHHSARRRG